MKNTVTNYGRSVRARLLNVSKQEGERFQQVVTRYLQERLLYRLSMSRYQCNFVLKGGVLLYAYQGMAARPTLDIDFMGDRIDNAQEHIVKVFREILSIDSPTDGVCFLTDTLQASDIAIEREYPGIRISVEVTLDTIRQALSSDIGFGDVIVPHPVVLDYPVQLKDMEEPRILAYSQETVVAEKFQTVIARSVYNSRMKDFFDLYRFAVSHEGLDEEVLREAVIATFRNRRTSYTENHVFFSEAFGHNQDLNTRWNSYLRKLRYPEQLPFNEVATVIATWLKPYWEKVGDVRG